MQVYKTKIKKFPGTQFHEVHGPAFGLYTEIKKKTKRRVYVRSAYFNKDKIFLDLFWHHLFEKSNWRDRVRRMKYFACAIELIQKSHFEPKTKENPNKQGEILHRFYGTTAENELFYVQIKEDKKKDQKFLISVFPSDGGME
ncbi:MAG: hypothetical protein US42_C0011G0002 [Candidatus Magasanikbacteria bacterium GW2011_GWC2_37_14]|uniref:Uncharacterized protein n=1 Tax=Candidatus Magasanikbacteria bacterium GW2011_GWC2_37_14 TaxID=1619046 RepID=A0A0G0ISY2_9BACT|nr:MAG: hypothetical protein US42_C0011G0002 [Candidatus Magasanikbacteria bacterium GW2011_GWC2_37_14]